MKKSLMTVAALLVLGQLFASDDLSTSVEFNAALNQLPKIKKSEPAKRAADEAKENTDEKSASKEASKNDSDISALAEKPPQKPKMAQAGASGEMVNIGENVHEDYPYIVRVADFGATPNDGIDDAEAIRRALASVSGKKGVRLVFGMGTYDLYSFERGYAAVLIDGFEKIMIDGGGATLVIYSSGSHLAFEKCSNVVLTNMDFECKKYPFVGGKVTAVGADSFDCSVPYGQEILEYFPKAVNLYDAQKNEFISGLDIYQNTTERVKKLDERNMRVPVVKGSEMPKVGDDVVVRYCVYGLAAVSFGLSKDVHMYNVNIWNHPGTGVYFEDSRDIFMDNVNVIPKTDAVWMTTTADALQFIFCRGKIDISNCRFERCGGDALNLHQMYWTIFEKLDGHLLKLKYAKSRAGFNPRMAPKKGDVLKFGAEDNWLRPSFESEIISVEHNDKEKYILVELSQMMPKYVDAGMPVLNASANPQLKISRTSAVSTRARGFSILTSDVRIENCEFRSTLYPAIIFECDNKEWFEGGIVDNVKISDCYFENCNKFEVKSSAAIYSGAIFSEGMPSQGNVYGAIRVENCKFEHCSDSPVYLDLTLTPSTKSNVVIE